MDDTDDIAEIVSEIVLPNWKHATGGLWSGADGRHRQSFVAVVPESRYIWAPDPVNLVFEVAESVNYSKAWERKRRAAERKAQKATEQIRLDREERERKAAEELSEKQIVEFLNLNMAHSREICPKCRGRFKEIHWCYTCHNKGRVWYNGCNEIHPLSELADFAAKAWERRRKSRIYDRDYDNQAWKIQARAKARAQARRQYREDMRQTFLDTAAIDWQRTLTVYRAMCVFSICQRNVNKTEQLMELCGWCEGRGCKSCGNWGRVPAIYGNQYQHALAELRARIALIPPPRLTQIHQKIENRPFAFIDGARVTYKRRRR